MTPQNVSSPSVIQYAASDVTIIDRSIVITCSDVSEANRAKSDAIAFGIHASTAGNQLVLHYDDSNTDGANNS